MLVVTVMVMTALAVSAQRQSDELGRGLVAVPTGATTGSTTNFVSWRRLGEEYYNVTYNLYKDGSLLASGLTKPSYDDNSQAYTTTKYQVAAVVNGVEQSKCTAITPWTQYVYKSGVRCATGYIDISLATVYDRDGNDVTANYSPNDAEVADLDGDGELEIIIKRLNTVDAANLYPQDSKEFVVFDAYDVDWQTGSASLMWRIDCGPNMVSLNSTEVNLIAYDWDSDGKAEVVLRGADDMIVHYYLNGTEYTQTIGTAGANYRASSYSSAQYAWTCSGPEYLIYMNGQTGKPYQVITYPLLRLESGETSLASAWGDGYGHRSSKYFFGAPYLDGRKPSLFLARGIYTRHKMVAYDINASSHTFTQRWSWTCNTSGSSWYGQGNHNYVVADVDWDGRDEIVYGSMVIDDNGNGLSTTGLGHGDAIHCSDLDPYRHGQEVFACNEDNPNMNYRDGTTSEIYYRSTGSSDDGRAMMANLSNSYPGSIGRSVNTDLISSVTDNVVATSPTGTGDALYWSHLNFRIYWDGDLCSEILDSPGTAKEAAIYDPDDGRLFTSSGCNMNNDSKNNPCFQGDIIGDWREEIIVRCGTNLRVYTSGMSTDYDIYTLWHDHQYRQAMVWQMMAYNQPPHPSFFLGELEGITIAPPPLIMNGRTEISSGGTISTSYNDKHVILCSYANMSATIASGAQPSVITVNAPTWVQGNNSNSSISTTTYTHTLNGSALSGATCLTKQGDGVLNLVNATHTHTGSTNIWAGTFSCNGTFTSSPLWLNRFATLYSSGGAFNSSVTAEYSSTIQPGGSGTTVSTITFGTLNLNFGSRVVFDLNGKTVGSNDRILVGTLGIEKKTDDVWTQYGPGYTAPVFQFNCSSSLSEGRYPIGTLSSMSDGSSLDDIVLEGLDSYSSLNPRLMTDNGVLYLLIGADDATTAEDTEATEGSVTYALQTGDTFSSGQAVSIYDSNGTEVAVITYGESGGASFKSATASTAVSGFQAFTAGNGVNGNSTGGTYYTITPTYDGTIEVAVVLNAGKQFYILEDGTALSGFNGITTSSKYYGTYSFSVKAGSDYKIYCSGSKLGFYGFNYAYTIPEDGFSYSWVFSNWTSGEYTSQTTVDGLTLIATSSRKVTVDSHAVTVDGVSYTKRLKFGGSGSSSYRNLQFDVPGSCTVTVVAAHAGSGSNRTLNICTGSFGNVASSVSLVAKASPVSHSFNYSGDATTMYIYSANSGINIYAIYVESSSSANGAGYDDIDGIETVNNDKSYDDRAYSITGQPVGDSYKGIVIVNGKKYVRK